MEPKVEPWINFPFPAWCHHGSFAAKVLSAERGNLSSFDKVSAESDDFLSVLF